MDYLNQNIQGNANISRNLNVGSHADIRGTVNVGHNLVVKGWVEAPNIKGPCKGLYASKEALETAYPNPMPGWFALVGNKLPASIYRVDGGKWVATGETGGDFQLYLDPIEQQIDTIIDDIAELQTLTAGGILMTNGVVFESTSNTASLKLTFLMRSGELKTFPYNIPIVTDKVAGMMTAADKKELTQATSDISTLKEDVKKINESLKILQDKMNTLEEGFKEIKEKQEKNDSEIAKLRREFDTLVNGDASDAIDNFNEIVEFLEGIKDSETLLAKLAALSQECENNKTELEGKISAEAQAREEADNDLSGKITAEAAARGEADKNHDDKIFELEKTVWPLVLTLSANPMLIEVGVQTNVTLSWEVRRKNKDVTAESVNTINSALVTGKSKIYPVNESAEKELSYILTAIFEGLTESKTVKPKVTYPTYFGSVPKNWTASEATVKALSKSLKGSREATYSGINISDGITVYAYPVSFGELTSIKDGNGYEILPGYSRTTVSINGVSYYCYYLTVPVTTDTAVTQIYK